MRFAVGLRVEPLVSLHWSAAAIPLVTLTEGLRGILEARQRLGSLSILRTATGVLTFVGPLIAARYWGSLSAVISSIAAIRLLSAAQHLFLCAVLPPQRL